MRKSILFISALFLMLFFSINTAFANPHHPHGGHGRPHPGMHRPPMHHKHLHHPPRMYHHVKYHRGFIDPYYYSTYYPAYYPVTFGTPRIHYPMHPGHFGASFHITL